MVKLMDIAKKLNVSPSTVSKALNNRPGVNPILRKKIIKVAKEMGYEGNIIAQSLRIKRTNIIGLIIPDVSNYFFGKLVMSIEKILYGSNYKYILSNTDENEEKEIEYLRTYLQYGVDGIISVTSSKTKKGRLVKFYRDFISNGKPLVFIDRYIDSLNSSYVILDNEGASYNAVRYLYRKGHKKIGIITGPKNIFTSEMRLKGFLNAIKDLNLIFKKDWIINGEYSIQTTKKKIEALINKSKELPTAILTLNNLMAIGAMEVLLEKGFKVPEEISILTFDDMPWHKFFKIPLTSINQPIEEMGVLAATILLENIKSGKFVNRQVVLKGNLIERGSVKKII